MAYGAGNWSSAFSKAEQLVSNMTLQEMNNITLGFANGNTGCVGTSGSVPRLGFPGFCLHDAGNGVRDTDGVNAYASGVSIGASWNASLALQRGQFMGAEFRTKGVNIALGPVVGPIGRIATNGRNWEGFGADPYLDGVLGAQSIRGLQEHVIASVKHFVAYEQETNRNPIAETNTPSTSANVDDKTMHELYLWPFQDAVYAGVGSVMCSYNRINGTYACENSKTINSLLKGELNFQGFVVSDWVGQHSGLPSASGGLDMAMPTSGYWDNDQLVDAVDAGLNKTRLTDMATRIVSAWYMFGQDSPDFPTFGVGMPPDITRAHEYVDAKDPASRASLLQQAIEGHVLVKNVNNALPLRSPKTISIFGYDAAAVAIMNPAPEFDVSGAPDFFTQSWQGLNITSAQAQDIASNSPVDSPPATYNGVLTVGGGSGSNVPAYISSPNDAIQQRGYADGTAFWTDFRSANPRVVQSSGACLVFINSFASEIWDRPDLADEASDQLVNNVAAQCSNTIVVIHNVGIHLVDAYVDNPNVTAILYAHLPGQDAGRAVTQVLYGDVSPSGRLPYTVAKQASDYGNLLGPCLADDTSSPQCDFTEGVNIDYRHFLAQNITPRYEFGFGLTYTTFSYSSLQVNVNATATDKAAVGDAPIYTNGTTQNADNEFMIVGGLTSLFESVGSISATITNTGNVSAAEVAQLYILIPQGNVTATNSSIVNTRTLRGFDKVMIEPGQIAQVEFPLRRKDVSRWDTFKQAWVVPSGEFGVYVGKSVLDTPLVGGFTL
jgi:beta-glucosidase